MNRPIRVLLYDHTAQLGGGEIALAELVRRLDRSRISPIVLLGSHGPLDDLLHNAAPVHHLLMPQSVVEARRAALGRLNLQQFGMAFSLLQYIRRLVAFLNEHDIDVVHTNSLKASILGGIAGRLTRKKVIWHLRDRISSDYLPSKIAVLVRALGRLLPHFVIGNSRATLATLHLRGTPTAAIPSGVDVERFFPALKQKGGSPASGAHKRIVGLVGRICPWKGQHVFIEAVQLLPETWSDVEYHIVGAALFGEQDYERSLREMVRVAGLEDVIVFRGFEAEVAPLIRTFYMLVHASTVGEPFGQVIVQAMATGKPVIATDGGGVPETITDGETGLLVPMGDAPAIASAISKLLINPELSARLGERGLSTVLERFTLSQTTEQVTKVYEGVCGRRRT